MKKIDKKVAVGMSKELYDRLEQLAAEDSRSISNFIRQILKEYVKEK